jgi:sRNA-binding regulator protein Hfq
MNYQLNNNFIYSLRDEKVSFTSVLPDMHEIFLLEGASAQILVEWFDTKVITTDKNFWKKKTGLEISDKDWIKFINFVVEKKMILKVDE